MSTLDKTWAETDAFWAPPATPVVAMNADKKKK
jgi:hypothetical protein